MSKQILTLDTLYEFFVEQNKSFNFNSKDDGNPIVVSTNGIFESNDVDMPGMLGLKLKVCHTLTNRNGSHISKENMEKALPTLKYRPILAHIHELADGTKDFYAHNMEIVENADGEEEINYIEKQVGCFTAEDPWLEYDEDMGKTYVMAYAVVPEVYTDAADIIRRKGGTKVSCELVINELSYNAKEKYLDLTDFYFGGTTLLGCDEDGNEIGEGMLGARADITDFCHKEPTFTYQDKLVEVLEKLNVTLSSFNKSNSKEGGIEEMDTFETDVVEEVMETEVEETAVEEEIEVVEEMEVEEETEIEEVSTSEDDDEQGDVEETQEEKFTKNFSIELSHDDIRYALYNLIGVYEEEDNEWYYIRDVYDSYFYMQSWSANKLYKVGYSVDGENVTLEGDRQEMFEIIVSESEKIAIDQMREEYSALVEFKANIEAAELKAQKDAVFAKDEYSILVDDEAFKALVADAEKFSVEDIEAKVKSIFADHVIAAGNFSAHEDEKKSKTIGFNFNAKPAKAKPYGNLFAKE